MESILQDLNETSKRASTQGLNGACNEAASAGRRVLYGSGKKAIRSNVLERVGKHRLR